MRKLNNIFIITCIIIIGFTFNTATAQCPMCKASVESNLKNGGNVGSGLNNGIMYLLAAPYIAMAGIGFLWYKKFKKKNTEINIKSEKLHLN